MQLVGLLSKMFCLTTSFTFSLRKQKKLDTFFMKHHYNDANDMKPGKESVGTISVMKCMINLQ
jgi:hypothetical protein